MLGAHVMRHAEKSYIMRRVMFMQKHIVILGLILISFACTKENIVSPDFNLVKTTIDLQMGFANHSVWLNIDTTRVFKALLSPASPLAGPEASFVTYLRQSSHQIVVTRVTIVSPITLYLDTLRLDLISPNDCYVGLVAIGDSVAMKVQDHPFGYALHEQSARRLTSGNTTLQELKR